MRRIASPRRSTLRAGIGLVLSLILAACAGEPPPEARPRPVVVEPEPTYDSVEHLTEMAEVHFRQGQQALRQGQTDAADAHFDTAMDILLDGQVTPEDAERLRQAFDDLVMRIHALKFDQFSAFETDAPPLPEEEIPPLTIEEIEILRSHLAEAPSAAATFLVPIPDPLDNDRLLEAVEYLSNTRREYIEEGLARAQRYLPMIRATFAAEGIPVELSWIPLIESLFKPHVRSRAAAVGMWQLMSGTARLLGLRVDWYVDERRDPIRATRAAARYLNELHERFGDWHLALAAYNGGWGRVSRAMRRTGRDDFWSLADTRYLPRETREFVPKVLAAILIGSDPERYGLHPQPNGHEPLGYDEVVIDSMTDLEVIADCAGTSLEEIRDLNPQLVRRTTPNVDSYTIRVPPGTKERFEEAFAAIPPDERVYFVEHRVRTGETLSTIADRYDTSTGALAELNSIRNRHRIRAGATLLVPVGQPRLDSRGTRRRDPSPVAPRTSYDVGERVVHTVTRGENLTLIAAAYRTTIDDIKRWNGLASDTIYPGNQLEIHYGERASVAAVPADQRPVRYTIQRGDTLSEIADAFGVSVRDLTSWNDISSRTTLYPGDQILVYAAPPDGTPTTYTVRPGDNLWVIAGRFGVSVTDLCTWNGISRRTTLHPGDELVVYRGGGTGDR